MRLLPAAALTLLGGSAALAAAMGAAHPARDHPAGSRAVRAFPVTVQNECPFYYSNRSADGPTDEFHHAFHFTRGVYTGGGAFGSSRWAVDYPKSDRQLLVVLQRLIDIDAYPCENPVLLDDPVLRRFPYLYILEVGSMRLTPSQRSAFRDYMLAGGFVHVDDFWGSREWANFEAEMRQVFPEYRIVDIPMDHAIFRTVYEIDEVLQVPAVNRGQYGPDFYYEQDGYVAYVRGIFDDKGRLMMVITWNSDLGDAWEWAEVPYYPLDRSTYAFRMAVNFIAYAMSR